MKIKYEWMGRSAWEAAQQAHTQTMRGARRSISGLPAWYPGKSICPAFQSMHDNNWRQNSSSTSVWLNLPAIPYPAYLLVGALHGSSYRRDPHRMATDWLKWQTGKRRLPRQLPAHATMRKCCRCEAWLHFQSARRRTVPKERNDHTLIIRV